MSSASRLRPFTGWMLGIPRFLRTFIVIVSLSGEYSQLSTASPMIVPSLCSRCPGLTRVSRL